MLGLVGEFFRQLGVVVTIDAAVDLRMERCQGIDDRLNRGVFFEALSFKPT